MGNSDLESLELTFLMDNSDPNSLELTFPTDNGDLKSLERFLVMLVPSEGLEMFLSILVPSVKQRGEYHNCLVKKENWELNAPNEMKAI